MFNSDSLPHKPLLLAHRGSRLLAPENTRTAFDLALSHGSDVLEIDIRLCRDKHIIVTHDDTVDRTTDGAGRVIDFTLVELKKLDAAYRFKDLFGNQYQGTQERFMTLNELLQAYPNTHINIDIKDNDATAAQVLAQLLIKTDSACRVNVGSFHSATIQAFRQHAPMISTAATQQEVAKLYIGSWLANKNATVGKKTFEKRSFNVFQIPRYYRGLPLGNRRFIDFLHSHNIPVMYWTVNDPTVMLQLLQSGADGIVTDRTDLAQKIFLEHQQRCGTNPVDAPQSTITSGRAGEKHDGPEQP